MDPLARLGARLAAALQGGGTEADRLLLLHTITDVIAVAAAVASAAGIFYLLQRRRDFDFRFLLLVTAGAFLAAAGAHGTGLWTLIQPDRWLDAWAMLAAAAGALGATIVFWMQLPDVTRLPTGRQQRRANAALKRENWDLQRKVQRLQDDALLLRSAVQQATVGMALLSAEGGWLHANHELAQRLALTLEELLKREPRQLLGDALVGAETPLEEERDASDPRAPRLRWSVRPLHDEAGQIRARLIHCLPLATGDDAALRRLEAQLAEQTRRAAEAVALMEHGLQEKERSEAALVRRAEQLERSAAQLERMGARITELAGTDPATGLGSSQSFAGRLEQAVAIAKRYGEPFALLVIAADPIDDLPPTDANLLGALGAVLRAELRETDAAARCDEERICVLLPQTRVAEAARVAERVRRRLAATPLAIGDGRTLRLSCCIGSAEWQAGQGLGEVLGQAAEALRNARNGGRNAVARG